MDTPTILIIVGITGDLAKRKLMPAVSEMVRAGVLPQHFHLLGITRQKEVDGNALIEHVSEHAYIRDHFSLFSMDFNNPAEYIRLGERLREIEQAFGTSSQRLFYLSVPPAVAHSVIASLGTSGLSKQNTTKLLIEKPFGTDLHSARAMIALIDTHFDESQVYRIDHYAAKEMAQNLIVFREHNSLFRRTWNNTIIERIEIVASESIGIEGRATFYEQTGAARDLVQSHLMQLAALTLMDLPSSTEYIAIPERRLESLRALTIPLDTPLAAWVRRGQYEGYRDEVHVPESMVETFTSITVYSQNPRWKGVPITLMTGKCLDKKATEIHIFYKKDTPAESNELTIHLQPNEGISMQITSKQPGYEKKLDTQVMGFTYGAHHLTLPEAYEHVLLDAIKGDHTLFTTSDEILETWRIIDPIQTLWKENGDDLVIYKKGSKASEIK